MPASPTTAPIIKTDGKAIVLDLSRGSRTLGEDLAGINIDRFSELANDAMSRAGTAYAFGRYGEDREIYSNEHFDSDESGESRSIHMGIDVFCVAGTPVAAPLDATIEIIANNTQELDYGPMLILKHGTGKKCFFSLYGHLNLDSISHLEIDQFVSAGEQIAAVGSPPENGNWPPHLHFQLILDLQNLGRNFPGVAYPSQADHWLRLSPSPAAFFPECDPAQLNCMPDP
jgi:murein DD-endopeptidase MepM/ murein hydrolase activator NlpD